MLHVVVQDVCVRVCNMSMYADMCKTHHLISYLARRGRQGAGEAGGAGEAVGLRRAGTRARARLRGAYAFLVGGGADYTLG